MRKILHMVFWALLVAGVVFAVAYVGQKHNETICEYFELSVENQNYDALTNAAKLRAMIIATTDTLAGKTIGEIKPYEIHHLLNANPYIKHADIQTDINGELKIKVVLRQAIIRIINKDGYSYYIGKEGWLMPVNPGFPSRVLIANGSINDGVSNLQGRKMHIDSLAANSIVRKLYDLAKYVNNSDFLNKLIGQLWITTSGELEIIPLIGEYTILFGSFDEMEEKFEKLATYYREGTSKAGWIDYRSVDLRYKNQVICSKK
ncbi:MAG: hypothetical protein KAT76_04380 [Bacteroidales bacterium]|nr:hypothetical protein [Bacteroidales bacterium]